MREHLSPGQCYPLGATFRPGGVNFSLFSKSARAVELLFFDDADQAKPARVIQLDPRRNKTFWPACRRSTRRQKPRTTTSSPGP